MIMTSFLNQLAGLIIDGKRNKGEPHKVRPYSIKLQIYFCCDWRKQSCFCGVWALATNPFAATQFVQTPKI